MTVECEEFEYCKVKVNYTADTDLVLEKREEVLEDIKKLNVKVPGFRSIKKSNRKKGKKAKNFKNTRAYELSLKKQYKKYIDEQVQKELVSEAYDEVLHETKMKPIGYPQINSSKLEEDFFECEMVFLKKPDFELQQYKGFEIPSPHIESSASERAEKMIQTLRERHGETQLYDENDFLQEADNVTLNVKSMHEDKIIESLTKEGLVYTVGQNTFAEFDHNLYGMKMGETRKFDILFEDKENINEDIRGKKVSFEVTLNAGIKMVPAPLDDSFAEKLGYESFDKLHSEAVGTASAQIERERRQLIANQVMNNIVAVHDFEVPQWLVLMESQDAARGMGIKLSDLDEKQVDELNKGSIKKIKLSMIMDSIRDAEPEAVFSEGEIIAKMRHNIEERGGNPDEVLSSAQKDGSLIGLVAKLRDEATIQWLVEQSSILDENSENKNEVKDGKEEERAADSGVSG